MGKNTYTWKTIFYSSKIAIYLSLGLHNERLSYRRSIQPSKENSKFFSSEIYYLLIHCLGSSLPSWIRTHRIHKTAPVSIPTCAVAVSKLRSVDIFARTPLLPPLLLLLHSLGLGNKIGPKIER